MSSFSGHGKLCSMIRRVALVAACGIAAWAQAPSGKDVRSPRISALESEVAKDPIAESRFWSEVSRSGTPLVEHIDGDARDVMVTFLWRGSPETRNVLVLWTPFAINHPADFGMRPIARTQVWYRTLRVRNDARFVYQLSLNDPNLAGGGTKRESGADTLNPHRRGASSIAELPDAVPQPWSQKKEDVPAGKVERFPFASSILHNQREIAVYTPADYDPAKGPFGLFILFDEKPYLSIVPTPVILDNLIAAARIPSLVAVLIDNPDLATRRRELPCDPDFVDFLRSESFLGFMNTIG